MNNKILSITNLAFLSLSVFFGYHYFKKRETKPDIRPLPACSTCGDDQGVRLGGIRATTALSMAENYNANQLSWINNSGGYVTNDARSVWFPLDTLKRFLFEIENQVCKTKCSDKAYGVRIYYAAYPLLSQMTTNPDLNALDNRYENLHTLFMIPTYTDATTRGPVDFDPWHMNGCIPKTFRQIRNSSDSLESSLILAPRYYSQNFQMRLTNTSSSTNTVQNHGGLCPPICQPPYGTEF